jgi:hypothetical protein
MMFFTKKMVPKGAETLAFSNVNVKKVPKLTGANFHEHSLFGRHQQGNEYNKFDKVMVNKFENIYTKVN